MFVNPPHLMASFPGQSG